MLASPALFQDCEPVVFIPLDETTAYRQVDEYFERANKAALAHASGIDDEELLAAILELGFRAETLPALDMVPIAFVAWASESVTDEECRAALWSIHENRLFDQPAAASRVQSWIDMRPDQALWDLWEHYTESRLRNMPVIMQQLDGKRLLEQATAVALASGGYFEIGKVCAAEREILDSIRRIFRIE